MRARNGDTAAHILVDLVPRLARVIARTLESEPEVTLSLRQYRILERLQERPHRTTELAFTSGVSQPTASAAVASLESRGLVARAPDPEDGRATLILLTGSGRAILRIARLRLLEALSVVTEDMTADDAAALSRMRPMFTAGMDRLRDNGPTPRARTQSTKATRPSS